MCWRVVESQYRISTLKLVDTLAEQSRLEELRNDPAELDRLLAEGSARAAELGAPVLKDAYQAVGLTR